jgi:hypothetical protein
MLNFYHTHKFTPLILNEIISAEMIYNTNFFEEFFTDSFVSSLGNSYIPSENYELMKKISRAHSLDQFLLDVHIIDAFPKFLETPLSVLVFIYLIRHSDKDFFFGTVDIIAQDLKQNIQVIRSILADFEELNMIQIEGKSILKIALNRKWT